MKLNLTQLESRDCPSLTAWLDTLGTLHIRGDSAAHVVRIATAADEVAIYGDITGHGDDSNLLRIYVDDGRDLIEVPPTPPGVDGNARLGVNVHRIEYQTSGPGSYILLDDSLGDTPVSIRSPARTADRVIVQSSGPVSVIGDRRDWVQVVGEPDDVFAANRGHIDSDTRHVEARGVGRVELGVASWRDSHIGFGLDVDVQHTLSRQAMDVFELV